MIALKRCTLALVAVMVIACGGNPNGPDPVCTDPNAANFGGPLPCVPKPPAQAFAELVSTSVPDGGTRIALDILPNGNKVGDPPIQVTIKFGYSQTQIDHMKSVGHVGLVKACLSVDGETALKGACAISLVEEGKTTDTKTFQVTVAKFNEYVPETYFITFVLGSQVPNNPNNTPMKVFEDGKFKFKIKFIWV